ncbi:serine protease 55-like [Uranotaenia lowii]|uniref:serine protease 55-like n=1 Tax=Uranotaenia lowii TaxID=190385 RepID=UPI00247A8677|nr:serine protease 55-like [Uranotaenia lowii]
MSPTVFQCATLCVFHLNDSNKSDLVSSMSSAESLVLIFCTLSQIVHPLVVKQNDPGYRCGQRPINHLNTIISGQNSWPGQFPWHLGLFELQQLGSSYLCGGFLVSDRLALTAAHCVTAPNGFQIAPEVLFIRLGLVELMTVNRNTQEHRVQAVHRHESFSATSYKHDVAILMLQTIVEFDDFVQPVCLWSNFEHGKATEMSGYVSGWGLTEYRRLANKLKTASFPMVSTLECLESDRPLFGQLLYPGMFCAGSRNGTTVCNGDSGGAFVVNLNGTWIARGIISFTGLQDNDVTLCNPKGLVGFVKIHHYLSWIEATARLKDVEKDSDDIFDSSETNYHTTFQSSNPISNPSISEKKCNEYQNGSKNQQRDLTHLAYLSRMLPSSPMRVIDCFVVLISERFFISRADCLRPGDNQFITVEMEGQEMQFQIENFHRHPLYLKNPVENNFGLIELKWNISLQTSQFMCLWTRKELDLGNLFLYSAMNESKQPPIGHHHGRKCFNQLLAPSIMIERPEDGVYHLVGLVANSTCGKIRFVRVQNVIPWIEAIVWGK